MLLIQLNINSQNLYTNRCSIIFYGSDSSWVQQNLLKHKTVLQQSDINTCDYRINPVIYQDCRIWCAEHFQRDIR